MKKLIAIMMTVCALTISAAAATPKAFYKPVKSPKVQITVPKMDFSAAIEAYLKDHPVT